MAPVREVETSGAPAALLRARYPALAALLVFCAAVHALRGEWAGDFWEHAAVVRELAAHPLRPRHPQLLLDAPHAFFSPYHLALGLLARGLGIDAVTVLGAAGVLNAALYALALHAFVRSLAPPRRAAPFYALLLTLLLWGGNVWLVGGLMSLPGLAAAAPYPATFALAATLLAFAMFAAALRSGRWWWCLPISLAAAGVLLCHAITFLFLGAGLAALACGAARPARAAAMVATALAVAAAAALAWPYFSLLELVTHWSEGFHAGNRARYTDVASRVWPLALALPVAARRFAADRTDPLVVTAALLACAYAWGAVAQQWTFGRTVANIGFTLQVALAIAVAGWESAVARGWGGGPGRPTARALAFGGAVTAVLVAFAWSPFVAPTLARCTSLERPPRGPYARMAAHVDQYDVVMADLHAGWRIPAFAGKTVAALHPLAFVPDERERVRDVERFFHPDTSADVRRALLDEYDVSHVLLRGGPASVRAALASLPPAREVVRLDDALVLVVLR